MRPEELMCSFCKVRNTKELEQVAMKQCSWDESVDVVIVGSGGGSMVAALKAKSLGMSVIILEKLDKIGGSTGYSGGLVWVPCNPLMEREGIIDSLEAVRSYIDAAVPEPHIDSSDARIDAYLSSGPEMVRYLEGEGYVFRRPDGPPDYYTTLPGAMEETRSLMAELFDASRLGPLRDKLSIYRGPRLPLTIDDITHLLMVKRTWRGRVTALKMLMRLFLEKVTGRFYVGAGAALQGRMLELAIKNGVDIRMKAAVDKLVEANGRLIGVMATINGKPVRIKARKAVVLNVGGFSHNEEMRKRYGHLPGSSLRTSSNPGDTGELIEEAIGLGAVIECMGEAIWSMISLGPGESVPPGAEEEGAPPVHFAHHFDISCPHSIIVDQQGRRFANEAGSYMEMGQRLRDRHMETGKGIPAWAIIDSRHRSRYAWGRHLGKVPQEWIDSGYMIKASSIAELADKCGIDKVVLEEQIGRFNGFAKTGKDKEFGRGDAAFDKSHGDPTHKPNPCLGTLEKPPFYATRIYPGDVGTVGGLVTDEHARVLRENGVPIPGLYAVGNTAAPIFGSAYIGGGASIGSSMIFAYRAVVNASSADSHEILSSVDTACD